LFDRAAVRAFQDWTAKTLQLNGTPGTPALRQFYGALVGFVGLLLLATPFLREITKKKQSHEEVECPSPLLRSVGGIRRIALAGHSVSARDHEKETKPRRSGDGHFHALDPHALRNCRGLHRCRRSAAF